MIIFKSKKIFLKQNELNNKYNTANHQPKGIEKHGFLNFLANNCTKDSL